MRVRCSAWLGVTVLAGGMLRRKPLVLELVRRTAEVELTNVELATHVAEVEFRSVVMSRGDPVADVRK